MSFFRPVYASNGTAYGEPIKGNGKDGDHRSYYETLSQNPTRSGLYHSAYSHRGLNQIDERSRLDSSPSDRAETLKGMKKILVRFADTTSVQGILYIKEAGRWLSRSFWIILFLLGTAAVVWQLYGISMQYQSHPISTTINIGYSTLNFPTVTICNMNPIRNSMLYLDPNMEKHMEKLAAAWSSSQFAGKPPPKRKHRKRRGVPGAPTTTESPDDNANDGGESGSGDGPPGAHYPQYDYYAENFGQDTPQSRAEYGGGEIAAGYKAELRFAEIVGRIDRSTRQLMGHQKNDTILSCSFNGRTCSPENFTAFLDKEYGNCFQFNGFGGNRKTPLKAREAGVVHGLNLVLYKQDREYLSGFTERSGFRILLNEFKTMAFPVESGFSVPTGVEANIGFKLVNMTRLGQPFWQCDNDVEFLKLYDRKYGIAACLNTCEDRLVLNKCNCVRLENYNNIPNANRTTRDCNTTVDNKCVGLVKQGLKKGINCGCRQSCQERFYDTSTSYAIWPNVGVWKNIVDLVCKSDPYGQDCIGMLSATNSGDQRLIKELLMRDFTSVKIYYTQLNYENIAEVESYGAATLAADVGGVIGLWLGFSVFSLFEVAYLLFQMCRYAIRKCRRPGRKSSTSTRPLSRRRKTSSRVITKRPEWLQDGVAMK